MIAVQEACARIGVVIGKGITTLIKERYNKGVFYGAVGLVLLANTINTGADPGAMAAAIQLLVKSPFDGFKINFYHSYFTAQSFH